MRHKLVLERGKEILICFTKGLLNVLSLNPIKGLWRRFSNIIPLVYNQFKHSIQGKPSLKSKIYSNVSHSLAAPFLLQIEIMLKWNGTLGGGTVPWKDLESGVGLALCLTISSFVSTSIRKQNALAKAIVLYNEIHLKLLCTVPGTE